NAADVLEITQDDADMTLKHMSGVSDEEEVFTPILRSAKSRGVWLGINLLTAFLAAFVIGQFEAVLDQIVALAILMPVVASMGGIAGSQTLTVVIRGLALGQIAGNNKQWLYNKELWVGMLNGLVWALVVGGISYLWFSDPLITLVITLAIFINMSLANMSGVLIPLVLKRLQIDPALSGAVILTTVTDVVGFLSFLGLATLIIL
ncbi:MAG TPA: magnesium transporter, partial [Halomonas sp.]|nr:magnesium transporter [Halomonas sp.]